MAARIVGKVVGSSVRGVSAVKIPPSPRDMLFRLELGSGRERRPVDEGLEDGAGGA